MTTPFAAAVWRLIAALVLCSVATGVPLSAAGAPPPLILSTVPFDDASEQTAVYGMLRRVLENQLGRPVEFQVGRSYSEVVERLSKREVDVGFVGALAYLQARRQGHVRAVLRAVRGGVPTYRGVIVAPRRGAVTTLADLRGRRVAFVDRSSTSGYFFPALLLRHAGLDPEHDIQPIFAGSHRRVVEMVAAAEVDAGACFDNAPDLLQDPESVRIISTTEPVPGDPVVVRPGLGVAVVRSLRSALIDLRSDAAGKTFLEHAGVDGYVPAVDADYDSLANMVEKAL